MGCIVLVLDSLDVGVARCKIIVQGDAGVVVEVQEFIPGVRAVVGSLHLI